MKFKSLAFLSVVILFACSLVVSAKETSLMTIDGSVFYSDGTTLVPNGWNANVTNTTKKLSQSSKTGDTGPGRYGVTFIDFMGSIIAATGDEIEIVITDAEGNEQGITTYIFTDKDIDANTTTIDIKLAPHLQEFPRWDVNEDGVVDIADLVLVGIHFGEDYRQNAPLSPLAGKMRSKYAEGDLWLEAEAQMNSVPYLQVQLKTTAITDLYGYQFDLGFDATSLELLAVTSSQILRQDGTQTFWTVSEQGALIRAMHVRQATKRGVNANGTLANIVFRVKDVESSQNSSLYLANIKLADSNAQLIPINIRAINLNLRQLFIPTKSLLGQNYPNPFNPETWIPYQLASDSPVLICIHNTRGQVIRTLNIGNQKAGIYMTKSKAAYWDGRDNSGEKVASGVYFYTLQTDEFSATRKLTIIK
ncbi:T9SS type A sorting domain-containing protein [Candidatus Poribacteria bacterium]|nr:T9SS type A sorting domain-containing protein [Candidatus Poribacteria bacterium]